MFDFGLGQITGFFQLGEKLVGYWKKWRQPPIPETLEGRFVRLFEAHGVHRNQIPRFFGHGLQLKDVQTDAALIQCLTDEHLADACQLFGVQRQWLERGEGQAHVRRPFYSPQTFGVFLDELLAASKAFPEAALTIELFGVLDSRELDSTLVVAEPIGLLNDAVVHRYHHVDGGPLGYWKSRVSVAAMVAQILARNLWVNGRHCGPKRMKQLTYEVDLWGTQEWETLMVRSRPFPVENWLMEPEALLEGVDPELNSFGKLSALELWLKLEAEGLMTHPFAKQMPRAAFGRELQSLGLDARQLPKDLP